MLFEGLAAAALQDSSAGTFIGVWSAMSGSGFPETWLCCLPSLENIALTISAITMNNAATWNDDFSARAEANRKPASRRVFFMCGFILAATAGLSACSISPRSQLFMIGQFRSKCAGGWEALRPALACSSNLTQVAFRVAVIGLAGGVATIIAFSLAVQKLQRDLAIQGRKSEEHHASLMGMRNMLIETRKTKEELTVEQNRLEEKLSKLTTEKTALEEELNRRNQAEKALKQKRFELESSKSVLELHVQARNEALQSLQRRYEMILNSAGEGICGLDLDGKATFVNPTVAKLTGWPVEELVGKREHEIFVSDQETVTALSADERVLHRKDGSRFSVEFVKTPDQRKRPNGRFGGGVQRYYRTQTGTGFTGAQSGRTGALQCGAGAVRLCGLARFAGTTSQNSGIRRSVQGPLPVQ